MSDYSEHDHQQDGIDRKDFLKRMAWAGTGIVWAIKGGVVTSTALADAVHGDPATAGRKVAADFSFVQITDTHIGFHQPPNKNVIGTFKEAIDRINALPQRPAFVIHTGDHVHLSTKSEFDAVKQLMSTIKTDRTFNLPGEHDVFLDKGKRYLQVFGRGTQGSGYFSFDLKGVHFLGLNNVQQAENVGGLKGLGLLGPAQIDFIKKDLKPLSSDTPLVIFAHVPLIPVYLPWGWGVEDRAQLFQLVRRFSAVTALNGHIHQLITKTQGNVVMHTAASTAYPLHPPGHVAPTPLVVPTGVLPSRIGIRTGHFVGGGTSPTVKDQSFAQR
jgi:3',5'-cyclic AMP phosphodiesterase CpdA